MNTAVIQINSLLAVVRAIKWHKPPANPVLNDLAIAHFRISISRGINFCWISRPLMVTPYVVMAKFYQKDCLLHSNAID